jgi:hypothetical protein
VYLRILLFVLIFYLVIRLFRQLFGSDKDNNDQNFTDSGEGKKVSKDIGEYVDYEDVSKE